MKGDIFVDQYAESTEYKFYQEEWHSQRPLQTHVLLSQSEGISFVLPAGYSVCQELLTQSPQSDLCQSSPPDPQNLSSLDLAESVLVSERKQLLTLQRRHSTLWLCTKLTLLALLFSLALNFFLWDQQLFSALFQRSG